MVPQITIDFLQKKSASLCQVKTSKTYHKKSCRTLSKLLLKIAYDVLDDPEFLRTMLSSSRGAVERVEAGLIGLDKFNMFVTVEVRDRRRIRHNVETVTTKIED